MKKLFFFFGLIGLVGAVAGQSNSPSTTYDSSFKALYKATALHPGYRNRAGRIHDSVVRRWDSDIAIFIEGGRSKERKEIVGKLRNTIGLITPSLNNKIKISFTDNKATANYLIVLTVLGRSGWYLNWDNLNNIYSCRMLLNTKAIFNDEQRAEIASHYFLKSLGDFVLSKEERAELDYNDSSVAANMNSWRKDITNIDLRILRLHYADDIKPGMSAKDIDLYFSRHGY